MTPAELLMSVVIPTYRRADDLDRAIRSVLAEPGDYFEVLVGDDGSPDHTPDVVAALAGDPRLRAYRNPTNLGMQDNIFKIAQLARGEYFFILTDDDRLAPGALAKVAAAIRRHPQAGYLLSHLPTVDERTGQIIHMHRLCAEDTLLEPGIPTIERVASAAWVLSRQVFKRDLVDWETWLKYKDNIFFQIIVAGRVMLKAPCYYIADNLVMHTWFNRVYWHRFGKNQIDIEFNLAHDRYQCMAAILHDHASTPEVTGAIERWQTASLRSYLDLAHLGFYDLIKAEGLRPALRRLSLTHTLSRRERLELARFFLQLPARRAWVNAVAFAARLPGVRRARERLRRARVRP